MAVMLCPNPVKDVDFAVTKQAIGCLAEMDTPVYMEDSFQPLFAGGAMPEIHFCTKEQALNACAHVVTIGGDGTLLRIAPQCAELQKSVLGVNLGRTGFLATCEVSQLLAKLQRLVAGDYKLEMRSLLQASAPDGWQVKALNDLVFYGESRLHPMDYTIRCNGAFVCRYRSDGVIVATPTGSTAYSLSTGGPVLDTLAPVFSVNGICAHLSRTAPMVFSDKRTLTVSSEADNREKVFVCADSSALHEIAPGVAVTVEIAPKALPLISFGEAEQFEAIETKLIRR